MLAFPCFVSGLLVLPLCGAAPTFLCLPQRKVGKRKRLKPLLLSGDRGLYRVVVHLESVFVPLHAPVTRVSYFQRRCARRSVVQKPLVTWGLSPSSCDRDAMACFLSASAPEINSHKYRHQHQKSAKQ